MKKVFYSVLALATLCAVSANSMIFPDYTAADFGFSGPVKSVSTASVSNKYFDESGKPVTSSLDSYFFDQSGKASKIVKDLGGTSIYTYDSQGHLTRVATTHEYGGRIFVYKYDGDNLIRSERFRPDGTTLYSYCDFAYNDEGDFVSASSFMVDKDKNETPEGSASCDYLMNTAVFTLYGANGKPQIITSYDKRRTIKKPTELNFFDRQTGLPSSIVLNVFNADNTISKTIGMNGNGHKIYTVEYQYDSNGKEVLRKQTNEDGTVDTVTTIRDSYGNPLKVTDSKYPDKSIVYTYTYYSPAL